MFMRMYRQVTRLMDIDNDKGIALEKRVFITIVFIRRRITVHLK